MSEPQKRQYEPVVPKEFRSTIPPHLLDKLSDTERYLVQAMSKLENQYDWLVAVAVGNNKNIIDLGGRCDTVEVWKTQVDKDTYGHSDKVNKLWEWKTMMSGKWAVLWAVCLVLFSTAVKWLFDHFTKKGP